MKPSDYRTLKSRPFEKGKLFQFAGRGGRNYGAVHVKTLEPGSPVIVVEIETPII